MEFVTSLWDPLCIGNEMFLWMNKTQAKKQTIPSNELIFEDEFMEFDNMKTVNIVILQLYPKFLVVRIKQARKIRNIMQLKLVKCLWTKDNDFKGINFTKSGQNYEIFTRNTKIYTNWKEALRRLVLVTDFHDEYNVTKQIGQGSFGRVYHAKRKGTDNEFAVKAFPKEALNDEEDGIQGLFNEIQILRELGESEYLMTFYEIHETVHSVYMVIEYLPGGELLKVISQQYKIKKRTIKKIMKNFLVGLAHVHSKGIIHRDLKPENLMLKTKRKVYSVKIIDFGLGTFVNVKEFLFKRCGTPGFVAPEVILFGKTQKYNHKADIFSAGIIFYILLKGSSPFPSNDFRKVLKMNKACKISYDGFDEFSPTCLDLLKSMLKKDPSKRLSALECLSHDYFLEKGKSPISGINTLIKNYVNKSIITFGNISQNDMAKPQRRKFSKVRTRKNKETTFQNMQPTKVKTGGGSQTSLATPDKRANRPKKEFKKVRKSRQYKKIRQKSDVSSRIKARKRNSKQFQMMQQIKENYHQESEDTITESDEDEMQEKKQKQAKEEEEEEVKTDD